jgi:ubiquinone/menaquinone biosynthesis C-methylase UbiE
MLARARERSADVRWVEGSAEKLPFDDESFDAIVTTEAFHWFDQARALADFRRVLADDGVLVIGVMTPSSPTAARAWSFLGAARWPTTDQFPRLVEEAGFHVVDQFKARRVFGSSLSSVVTVAEAA